MNLRTMDHKLTCLLHDQSGKKPWLDKLAIFCARDLPFVLVLLPLVFLFRSVRSMIIYLVFIFVTQLVAYSLQQTSRRARPFQRERLHPIYSARISSPSFPSGHATFVSAVSFWFYLATAGLTLPYAQLVFWVMIVVGMLIILARVYGGLHYVSDILAGLVLGSGMVLLFVYLAEVLAPRFV